MGVTAGVVAIGAGAAGAANSISSLVNSPSNSSGTPGSTYGGSASTYVPQGQATVDQGYQSLLNNEFGGVSGFGGQLQPYIQGLLREYTNTDYGGIAQNFANNASAYGTGTLTPQLQGASSALNASATNALPYGNQILQNAFDPQSALYNRTQQQVADQLNAVNAQSGLSASPYGAGVAGQGLSNFNIDWQNNQLNRENQGIQGYGSLLTAAGRGLAGGADLGTAALNAETTAGGLPYSTYLAQRNNVGQGLGTVESLLTNAYTPQNNLSNLFNSYLGLGQSATQQGLYGQNQAFNQGQINQQNLGTSLSGLNNLFSSGQASNAYNGLFGTSPSYADPSMLGTTGDYNTFNGLVAGGV